MTTVLSPEAAVLHGRRPSTTAAGKPRAAALCTMESLEPTVPAMRRFACRTARRWGVDADVVDTLALVVTELVTNAVLHSGGREVAVLLRHRGTDLTVEVRDGGQWYTRPSSRRVPEDAGAACGRGLDLVRHVTDWWLAFLSSTGTRVMAGLPLSRQAG
ncbi:ATP-binding protein [Streptomyces litmocidini]|uniref:ATP-binding protein n=1 Tax=Streptomyces litmocidini TaxID=67318 RepID=UPI0033ED6A70